MDKVCFKCERRLPISSFYKHRAMADGHLNKCIACAKADEHARRRDKIDEIRAYDRARGKLPKRLKNAAKSTRKWRGADKRRNRAHVMVARAMRNGDLQKKPCSICGKENAYAHHDNYDFPLDVIFLCQVHHKERHAQLKAEGRNP